MNQINGRNERKKKVKQKNKSISTNWKNIENWSRYHYRVATIHVHIEWRQKTKMKKKIIKNTIKYNGKNKI